MIGKHLNYQVKFIIILFMKKLGRIIIPLKHLPQQHELETAQFFANHGKIVEFIMPNRSKGIKNADIKMDSILWEIKSPFNDSQRTIEHLLRKALKQSKNIIFDLRRLKVSDAKCITQIKYQFKLIKGINRIIIITKYHNILDFKK
ncbi:hypothetical protein [Endomicrobium proavitum]|nr:hypothetical protein [Endomicrobium proavitum]